MKFLKRGDAPDKCHYCGRMSPILIKAKILVDAAELDALIGFKIKVSCWDCFQKAVVIREKQTGMRP